MTWVLAVLSLAASSAAGQAAPQAQSAIQPAPILTELRLEGATVYQRDDVLWLLRLREGAPLPGDAQTVAKSLQERYERDGYSEARVTGEFEAGRLTLAVDEGRIDEVELRGIREDDAERYRRDLEIRPGDIYNRRVVGRATAALVAGSRGALSIGAPRRSQPQQGTSTVSEVVLERRAGRSVLVIPLRWNRSNTDGTLGSGREDLYSPADGFSPAVGFSTSLFDHRNFNHTFVDGYVSYKFGRDDPGYSAGIERPVLRGPARLFLGGEIHDVTASDDWWRISTFEQTLVSLAFKNSFRDYYRRRGAQVFGVLHAGPHNELSAMVRWDRHEPLANATSYSFFRDDAMFRPALAVEDRRVNALVLGYTFDTRALTGAGNRATYVRHLKDSLYGSRTRQNPGLRLDWTSEIAGRALNGDADFDRHILHARGHLPLSRWTTLSLRGLFGFSNGTLPAERLFAVGGIGSVHGYRFKEARGTGMALINAEYRVDLSPGVREDAGDRASVFVFYDAGRVTGDAAPTRWLRGVGAGIGAGGVRLEIGFRAAAIPRSRQILLRFSPTF
ncbi:MAG TPA: BamA/TamA family outer membrane protein [Vicinamibacterales bacterium]|nr:BamA/TamA family outer membrane protein [Vicinamibacterales bacterium]